VAMEYYESDEQDLGTIVNWASPGSKKYRWTKSGNKVDFWFYITATGGSPASNTNIWRFDLPSDVPSPQQHLSNDVTGELPQLGYSVATSGSGATPIIEHDGVDDYKVRLNVTTASAITRWGGHLTYMTTDKS